MFFKSEICFCKSDKFTLLWFTMWFIDYVSLKSCLVTYLFLRAFGCENALRFCFWPSSLRCSLAGGFPCVPLAGSVYSGLVLVVMTEGCSPYHLGHMILAFFRRPRMDGSLAFSVARCYL